MPRRRRGHTDRTTNPTATAPTIERTTASDVNAAVMPPTAMPTTAAGNIPTSVARSNTPRHVHKPTASIASNRGSNSAAACTGDITSDKIGTPNNANAPPMPPFDKPTNETAATPTSSVVGSAKCVVPRNSPNLTRSPGHAPTTYLEREPIAHWTARVTTIDAKTSAAVSTTNPITP